MKNGKVNQVGSAETEASGICNVEMLDIDVKDSNHLRS